MDNPELKTRNVFLDTSAFINENFGLKSTAFKSLISLAKMGSVFIKTTDITLREIKVQLRANLENAQKTLMSKKRDIRVLRNDSKDRFLTLFEGFNTSELEKEIWDAIETDLKNSKTETLEAVQVPASKVFDMYFDRLPPFGSKEKKAEFPDAFVICSLESWCATNNALLYVVSSDNDMRSACEKSSMLLHLSSIAEFVDLVIRTDSSEADFLLSFFMDNSKRIVDAISAEVSDKMIDLKDEDGEGEVVSVDNVTLELESSSIIEVGEERAVMDIMAEVSFTASVSYKDQNTASYDSEDKTTIYWDDINETLERTVYIPVEIALIYSGTAHLEYEVEEITINGGDPISIFIDEAAETHWK
jgi:hypothetical protein